MERKKSLSGIKIQAIDGADTPPQCSIVSSPARMLPGELYSQSPARHSCGESMTSAPPHVSFSQISFVAPILHNLDVILGGFEDVSGAAVYTT